MRRTRYAIAIILIFVWALFQSPARADDASPADYALALMLKAQPKSPRIPWAATYETTAAAIASAATAKPLYPGTDGIRRTISVMIGVAFYESHFDPKAEGDCPEKDANGMCIPGSEPRSFCAFQIDKSNFAGLGITKEQILSDINICSVSALRMMRKSFDTCKGWKPTELLNQYATGGGVCVKPLHDEGETRMYKGQWLYNWYNKRKKD